MHSDTYSFAQRGSRSESATQTIPGRRENAREGVRIDVMFVERCFDLLFGVVGFQAPGYMHRVAEEDGRPLHSNPPAAFTLARVLPKIYTNQPQS